MIRIAKCMSTWMLLMLAACGGHSELDGTASENAPGGSVGGKTPSAPGAQPQLDVTCPTHGRTAVDQVARYTGDNGTFVDHCDADGNLVRYACGMTSDWVCNDWECYTDMQPNSTVVEEKVDCAGKCNAGRCTSFCPATGDVIRYDGVVNGTHRIFNLTAGFDYQCDLVFNGCALPAVGATKTVEYYNAAHKTCVGADDAAALGFDAGASGPNCVFTCSAN